MFLECHQLEEDKINHRADRAQLDCIRLAISLLVYGTDIDGALSCCPSQKGVKVRTEKIIIAKGGTVEAVDLDHGV